MKHYSHRWSGWPGAWCLDCGREDPTELCACEHEENCSRPECDPGECPEPNSHGYDPYYHWPDGTYHPIIKHPYTCGICSWGRDGAYHDKAEYDRHMKEAHWTGNPTCWICGNEYEPYTGDGDGACYYCYNGVPRE